uniref:TIR domain-containing protein n=1 Tax=Nelumbo nucifera TaxID=4432 RepID=A0A822ZRA7_NELNU|nr:TPA_asm: hypothetical protein HUJ06_004281 [Nelumbo nucifera]
MVEQEEETQCPVFRWDVFLNFKGVDTRHNFTGCLYNKLLANGIRAFWYDQELESDDEEIKSTVFTAIKESAVSIAVISENYASSSWCLEELARITECWRRRRHLLPVFYRVDPSHVRRQNGPFEMDFRNLEQRFGKDKVLRWKKAMEKAGGISGWDSRNCQEPQLIKDLVEKVLTISSNTPLDVAKYPVGINSRVEELMKVLDVKSHDVRIVVFHGMGGIGKTTLARAVYNKMVTHFEHCSFISNVRETSKNPNGLVSLQNILLHDLFPKGEQVVEEVSGGILIIKGHQVHEIYEVQKLNLIESLELFSHHAFGREKPAETLMHITEEIVTLTGQLPLALEVFGAFILWDKDEIMEVLSSKKGTDRTQGITLDFTEENRKESDEFCNTTRHRISTTNFKKNFENLFNHGRVKDKKERKVCTRGLEPMVNLRLLQINHVNLEGSFKVILTNLKWLQWKGCQLDALPSEFCPQELAVLDLSESKIRQVWDQKWWQIQCNMAKELKVMNLHSCHKLIATPDFSWYLNLEKLILENCSGLMKIHKSVGKLCMLLLLNLRCCSNLQEFPNDISGLGNLKILILSDCSKLKDLPEDLKPMKSLTELLVGGTAIRKLPDSVCHLTKLERLILDECVSIRELPGSIVLKMTKRMHLKHQLNPKPFLLPISFSNLSSLQLLDASSCKLSNVIPDDFEKLSSLEILNLSRSAIYSLPSSLRGLSVLTDLLLTHCIEIKSLPPLPASLTKVDVSNCTALKSLPDLSNLRNLEELNLTNCEKLMDIPGLECLKSLRRLYMSGCNSCHSVVQRFPKATLRRINYLSVPGNEIPDWLCQEVMIFSSRKNQKLEGVIIYVVLSLDQQVEDNFRNKVPAIVDIQASILRDGPEPIFTKTLYLLGVPKTQIDQVYICRFFDYQPLVSLLRDGDRIQVAVRDPPRFHGLQLKKYGISLVFEDDDDADYDDDETQKSITGELSEFLRSWEKFDHKSEFVIGPGEEGSLK